MAPINDELLDKLLTRHLSARLDGQLGQAELAFRRRLVERASSSMNEVAPPRLTDASFPSVRPSRTWNPSGRWRVGLIGTAVAACLATLWILPRMKPNSGTQVVKVNPATNGVPEAGVQGTPDQPLVRYVHDQTWDDGTVTPIGGGSPMRRVRHQQVEHMQWYDAQRGAKVEVMVPRENVELYELDTY